MPRPSPSSTSKPDTMTTAINDHNHNGGKETTAATQDMATAAKAPISQLVAIADRDKRAGHVERQTP